MTPLRAILVLASVRWRSYAKTALNVSTRNIMGTKLSVANRYLRNPEVREQTVIRSVATSSAIEGIRALFEGGAKTGASSKIPLKRKRP